MLISCSLPGEHICGQELSWCREVWNGQCMASASWWSERRYFSTESLPFLIRQRRGALCDVSSSSRNQYFQVKRGRKCCLCFTSRLEILGLVQDHFSSALEFSIPMSRSSLHHLNTFHTEHHIIIIYSISSSPVSAARQTCAVKCFPFKGLWGCFCSYF